MIRRIGERCPGREIGIRVNPGLGAGYADAEKLVYAGRATTKFGIYREQWPDAVQMARRFGLKVTGLHFHVGCRYLTDQLPNWDKAVAASLWFMDAVPQGGSVHVGRGLGLPPPAPHHPLHLA